MNKYTIFVYLIGISNFPLAYCEVEAATEAAAIVAARVQYAINSGTTDTVLVGHLFTV